MEVVKIPVRFVSDKKLRVFYFLRSEMNDFKTDYDVFLHQIRNICDIYEPDKAKVKRFLIDYSKLFFNSGIIDLLPEYHEKLYFLLHKIKDDV